MTTTRARVLRRLELVCEALGPELLSRVTLVGGTLQAVLPLTTEPRLSKDVDFVLPTTRPLDWQRFLRDVEGRGFAASRDEGAPICRYEKRLDEMKLIIDVMPTDDRLGFTNRWYGSVHEHRQPTEVPGLFAASPLDYLLTKIEAFHGRGTADPLASHDLEDIVLLTRGHPTLLRELRVGEDTERHREARAFLRSFAAAPDGRALLLAHTEGDAQSQNEASALHRAWLELDG